MPMSQWTLFHRGIPGLIRLCLVMCLVPSTAPALDFSQRLNQLNHTSWTAKDGLTGSPLCLAQPQTASSGSVQTDGLFRFDGVQFERFRPNGDELPALSVSALLAVPDGGLWVGYFRGRATFINRDGRVVNYSEQDGLPVSKVRSLARTPDGAVWVAAVGGLARFDGSRWQKVRMDWNYPCRSAWRLHVDRQGTLWVGAASPNGLYFLPKGTRKFEDTGMKKGIAVGIALAADGSAFVMDDEGGRLYTVRGDDEDWRKPHPIAEMNGQQLVIDRDGGVWVAGYDILRLRVADRAPKGSRSLVQTADRFTRKEGLSGNISIDVLEDREGNIWVATEGGLDRFRSRNLTWERHRDDAAAGQPRRRRQRRRLGGLEPAAMAVAGAGPHDRGESSGAAVCRLPRSRRIDLALRSRIVLAMGWWSFPEARSAGDGDRQRHPFQSSCDNVGPVRADVGVDRRARAVLPERRQMDFRGGPPGPPGSDCGCCAH